MSPLIPSRRKASTQGLIDSIWWISRLNFEEKLGNDGDVANVGIVWHLIITVGSPVTRMHSDIFGFQSQVPSYADSGATSEDKLRIQGTKNQVQCTEFL